MPPMKKVRAKEKLTPLVTHFDAALLAALDDLCAKTSLKRTQVIRLAVREAADRRSSRKTIS